MTVERFAKQWRGVAAIGAASSVGCSVWPRPRASRCPGRRGGCAGVRAGRLDQGREGHAPLPVRFPAAQERHAAAAHPELPEHLHRGLQDRRRVRSAPSARSTAWAARRAFRWRSTTRSGRSTSSASTPGSRTRRARPYTRNVFNQPTAKDLHLLMQAIDSPTIPALADAMPALGIESLQKMGAKFLLCANALGIWCLELEARGKGKAADIEQGAARQPAARRDDRAGDGDRDREGAGGRHQVQPSVTGTGGRTPRSQR